MKYFIRTSETSVADFENFIGTTLNASLVRIMKSRGNDLLLTASRKPDGTYRVGWLDKVDEDWALNNEYHLLTFREVELTPIEMFKEKASQVGGRFKFTNMKVDGGVDLKYIEWAKKFTVVYHGDGAARVVERVLKGRKRLAQKFITLEEFLSQ